MKPCLRITLWYLLFGGVWIFVTDWFLGPLSENVETLTCWQTSKGMLYVLVSGCLVFFLARRATRIQELEEKKRLEGFKRTVRHSHHILLNYLNQMQLFILEAERSEDFDKNLIELAKKVTDDAAKEVLDLENRDFGMADEKPENRVS